MICRKNIDESSIGNEEIILRGISPNLPSKPYIWDPKEGKYRFSSVVFQHTQIDECISVYLNNEVTKRGYSLEDVLGVYAGFASLTASQVRSCYHGIYCAPTPDCPYHANIFDKNVNSTRSSRKLASKKLARMAQWALEPKS